VVNADTATLVPRVGAQVVVAGSAVFDYPDGIEAAIRILIHQAAIARAALPQIAGPVMRPLTTTCYLPKVCAIFSTTIAEYLLCLLVPRIPRISPICRHILSRFLTRLTRGGHLLASSP